MTDPFSSASKRNLLRRHWPRFVGALAILAIAFLCWDWLAMYLGYAETVTETVIENGKETTSWLSPGARLLRDLFIGTAAILGIVMAGWRNFALDRQSKAASEQARNDSDRIAGERFSDAVKLLAQKDAKNKPAIDARIGGIYSLQTLAINRIKEYGVQVVKMLIAYIKQNAQLTAQSPLKENAPKEARTLGEDVKTAFNVLRQLLAAREKDSAEWNKPSDGIKLSDQDLSFSGQDFSWLDLSASQVDGLYRYIWSQVNLQGANLLGARLQSVNLERAKLQDAQLSQTQLNNANLAGAKLQDADLTSAKLQDADLTSAELHGAKLTMAELNNANLKGAELHGAELLAAKLHGAKLAMAELQGAKLHSAELHGAELSRTQLHGAELLAAELHGAKLVKAGLQYTDLSEAKLDDVILSSNLPIKIWHSGQPELLELKIASLSPDAEWDLVPFLRSGYMLAGVLHNFALPHGFIFEGDEHMIRAKKLRIAVCKLLDEGKLPENFPQHWRDWLGEIESDGSHPNDY